MPAKNFRAFYRGLDEALAGLYLPEDLTLAAGEKGGDFEFDSAVFERAAEWIHEKGVFSPSMMREKPAREVIAETYRILDTAISAGISAEMPDDLVALLQNNAFIFSGFKTYHSLSEVGLSLIGRDGGIKPFEEFRRDVEKIDEKYNRNYLNAEYNHAVSASQMASKWHDFEAAGDRYDLQYRTAGDEKVREEHARLHDITLPFDDPFWDRFLPPNGWNCRCTTVQVRKGKYPASDSAQSAEIGEQITADPKKQIFRFNPGKELKVFPDKHPYNKAPQEAKEAVQQLAQERVAGLRKEVDAKVKEWFQSNLPDDRILQTTAAQTGEIKFNAKSIKRYLHHAATAEAKWMLKYVVEHPDKLKYVQFSPLGATKNMDDPAHIKNVAKKEKRNVVGYHLYEFEYRSEVWIVGFEEIKQGEKSFEQPYYAAKKKP